MNIATILSLLLLGLFAGLLSSMVGIGGGLVIVPGLVLIMAMSQKMAQGTSLALMLPPLGFFAVMNYYKEGFVNFKIAGILCLAFVLGSIVGSKFALNLPEAILKKIFGVFLLIMSAKYLMGDKLGQLFDTLFASFKR
jgi:hypothetical protein